MTLAGTRPILQDELRQYELHHRARIAIKPGITGMWQVSGRSDITDFEEVVRLDTEYISNWNFGLDIKILFKTVIMVLKRPLKYYSLLQLFAKYNFVPVEWYKKYLSFVEKTRLLREDVDEKEEN